MKIRDAVLSDSDEILRIYEPYILNTPVTFEYEVPTAEDFKNRMLGITEKYPYLVAEDENGIAGYAYAHDFKERRGFGWDAELSVYLKIGMEKRGIGTALYKELIPRLKKMGVVNVYANIAYPNPGSIALHEKFGLKVEGILKNTAYKLGEWHDLVIMGGRIADELPENPAEVKKYKNMPL